MLIATRSESIDDAVGVAGGARVAGLEGGEEDFLLQGVRSVHGT